MTEPDEDADVFAGLYQGLRRFACVVASADVDPDDLVQEAVVRTLARHRLTELDDPAAYLRTTIVRLHANERRRLGRARRAGMRMTADSQARAEYPSDVDELRALDVKDRTTVYLAVIADRGSPRGSERVLREARTVLRRRKRRRRVASAGIGVVVATVAIAVAVEWRTGRDASQPIAAIDEPKASAPAGDTLATGAIPATGLAILNHPQYDASSQETTFSATFVGDDGAVIGRRSHLTVTNDVINGGPTALLGSRGRVQLVHRPLVAADEPAGCALLTGDTALRVAICGPRIGDQTLGRQLMVRRDGTWMRLIDAPPVPPSVVADGHWVRAMPSPDGKWVLAQWSGECESLNAFLISVDDHSVVAVTGEVGAGWISAPESSGLGWTSDRAIVRLSNGCNADAKNPPGIYLVSPTDRSRRLLTAVASDAIVLRWTRG